MHELLLNLSCRKLFVASRYAGRLAVQGRTLDPSSKVRAGSCKQRELQLVSNWYGTTSALLSGYVGAVSGVFPSYFLPFRYNQPLK